MMNDSFLYLEKINQIFEYFLKGKSPFFFLNLGLNIIESNSSTLFMEFKFGFYKVEKSVLFLSTLLLHLQH